METKAKNPKRYDLEDRTRAFAREVRLFVKTLPKNTANFEDAKQLVRSSGSVGANYIEANESLSKKDFLLRIRIARKEAKESQYWLDLIDAAGAENACKKLAQEAKELMMILSAIMRKSE
jgi:four helix bundle protein